MNWNTFPLQRLQRFTISVRVYIYIDIHIYIYRHIYIYIYICMYICTDTGASIITTGLWG